MKKLSKILVPILVIALALCAFFVVASAAEGDYEASVGTKKYETFEEAVKAASKAGGNATVKVLRPVTVDEQLEITGTMTIDLGGNTVAYKPGEFFQTFISVNAEKAGTAVTLTITGNGCLDVSGARLFNLKSTTDCPASVEIKGAVGGYGTYIYHEGDYATLIAGEGASFSIEDAALYISGDCVDMGSNRKLPAKFQLDSDNTAVSVKNAEIIHVNTSVSLFRIISSNTSVHVEGSQIKTTDTMFKISDGANLGNDSFVVVDINNSILIAENTAGGNDRLFDASAEPASGTVNVKNSRLTSAKIVYAAEKLSETEHKVTVNIEDSDITSAMSGSGYAFATGQAYVNVKNCCVASDGALGLQTAPEYFTFTDCKFSAKAVDGDCALAGGDWYLTFADASFPWVYLTTPPAQIENADYFYMQSFDNIVLNYVGGHMEDGSYVACKDLVGNFSSQFEATVKIGDARTESADGNSYLKYEMVDPYAGTQKASANGKVIYNSSYFPEQQGGYDAYYVFGPGYTPNFDNAAIKLTDYETIVYDFDFRGSAAGYAPVFALLYHRNSKQVQTSNEIFSTSINTIKMGKNTTIVVEDPTEWHHVQFIYYVAKTDEIPGENEGDEPTYTRSYVGKVDMLFDGVLKETYDFNYNGVDPSDLYFGGLRNTVRATEVNIGSSICYDNLTIRAYKNEATRVTVSPTTPHKDDTERTGVMIGDTVYSTLADALAAAKPSDTIYLYKDVDKENITITTNVKIVSNGYALPTFTYIDNENSAVYSYAPIYSDSVPYRILVIDENYHPQYLYPALSADFVVIRDGEIVGAGNGADALINAFKGVKGGDIINLNNDFEISEMITISKNLSLNLGGAAINVAPELASLFKLSTASVTFNVYSSKPGAAINAPGNTKVFDVTAASATVNVGKHTDIATGEVYSGNNLTVNAITLAYVTKNGGSMNFDGGVYNCIGYNSKIKGFVYSYCTSSSNLLKFNFKDATVTLNDAENTLCLSGSGAVYGSYHYNSILTMDGCTVYGSETNDGVNMHSVSGYFDSKSTASITNSYFYNVAMLRYGTSSSKGTFTIGRGNFSTVRFDVISDGETTSTAKFATGISALALDKTVPMAFASAAQTEISVNGEPLALSSLTTPLAYYTGAGDDVFVRYTIDDFTSRTIIVPVGTDFADAGAIPADIYNQVAPAVEGLYTVGCQVKDQQTGEDGVVTVALEAKRVDALGTLSSLQLYDSLNYVVYLPKSAVVSGLIDEIRLGGKVVYTAEDEVEYVTVGTAEYVCFIKEVGAANAATEFELDVTHGYIGSDAKTTQRVTLSLEKYAKGVLDSAGVNAAGKQLVCDVLYYVNAIRTYTGEIIPAGDGIAALIENYKTAGYTPKAQSDLSATADAARRDIASETVKAALEYITVNISKDSANIRFIFDTEYTGTVTLTYKSLAGEDVSVVINVSELEDGYYDLELRAYYLISDITITTDAEEAEGNVYNFASYVYYITTNYTGATSELVEALYAYALSAKAYKG